MLLSTFHRLLRGISADEEARLWRRGIHTWSDFETTRWTSRTVDRSQIRALREAYEEENIDYFAQVLKRSEHFRIALSFPHRTLFLDIETTGLSRYYDSITLVGWSYNGRYQAVVQGYEDQALRDVLREARVVVTFNGSNFDLPFLRDKASDLSLPKVHVDLRYLAKRVGLTGGQKDIEGRLGFRRPPEMQNMKGEAAPLLWHQYKRGDLSALKLLIEYNHCDIEGMKFIFDRVVAQVFRSRRVPLLVRKSAPTFAVPSVVEWSSDSSGPGLALKPFRGLVGPAITLDRVVPKHVTLRSVGIDLTGSEARATGWALLDGNSVSTTLLSTDEELLRATCDAKPHVVSIDSPLSLPKGRRHVRDDDPGRDKYGIMRISERVLKKRGINSYPALILSMQKLTARGIRLAAEFRRRGVPVIECYPGAAQDIIGIPRKRASLEMLRVGLSEFGVKGDFLFKAVSHDELDAITGAIVGAFFYGGRFESLGSEEEEALIIPDLHVDPVPWLERRVVGLSGPIAAGKTTAARILEGEGYAYIRYSEVLEKLLEAKGKSRSRSDLQTFGAYIHRVKGQRWLGRQLLSFLPKSGDIVIDGLRFADDHSFWIETFGPAFHHLHIVAPESLRRSRFIARGASASFSAAQEHLVEGEVETVGLLAHCILPNESDVSMLGRAINSAIARRSALG
jgi:uncharacterized protein YprB with RNaseH-like and TPR domain/predicted nuclease with RNAse H fold